MIQLIQATLMGLLVLGLTACQTNPIYEPYEYERENTPTRAEGRMTGAQAETPEAKAEPKTDPVSFEEYVAKKEAEEKLENERREAIVTATLNGYDDGIQDGRIQMYQAFKDYFLSQCMKSGCSIQPPPYQSMIESAETIAGQHK